MYLLIFVLLQLFYIVNCGKILIYSPSISYSHLISNGRIADTLVDAGHDVVMFIPEYLQSTLHFNGTKKAKVIRMNGLNSLYADLLTDMDSSLFTTSFLSIQERLGFEYILNDMCNSIMQRREELEVLRNYHFDVAFSEQIDLCGVGIIRYLGIDNHLWISTTAIMDAVSYNLGIPQPSSYVPTIEENDNSDMMSFSDRAWNMYMYAAFLIVHRIGTDRTTEVIRRYVGPTFPNVREIASNSSLCFVNNDEMFDLARPIIHKTIYIGGLGMRDPKPLTKEFEAVMSKGKKGVIVFSLGTIAPFHALPNDVQRGVFRTFQSFSDYHFILKITKDDNETEEIRRSVGVSNVDLVDWIPQSDLLGHPRLRLFIMHGGLNGLIEAVHRGVPLIVIPVFADQFRNGRNVEKRGMGKVINKLELSEKTLTQTVATILEDKSYSASAGKMSKLLRERPFSSEERLVKWTEFAINNGVLDTLHVEGSRMNSIVYFNLDVIAVMITVFLSMLYSVYRILVCMCTLKKRDLKVKTH